MASGFTVSGRGDLDSLFMARQNAARANVGFTVVGVDLANRYEPIGSASPIAATGFTSGGTDLASLFRDINQPLTLVSLSVAQVRVVRDDNGAPAELHLDPNGIVYHRIGSTLTNRGTWISDASQAANYESRLTVRSGTLQSGSNGVWETLNVRRSWAKGSPAVGMGRVDFDLEIRRISTGAVEAAQYGVGYLICYRG